MRARSRRSRRISRYRRLIHLLNQRYHQEFVRAERLAADLALLERFRLSWCFRLLRVLRSLFQRQKQIANVAVQDLRVRPVEITGKVSIVIPFRDRGELLRDCLASLRTGTYPYFEIILVDNGSQEPALLRYLSRLERRKDVRVVRDPGEFNFSRLCNQGAAAASGDWLLLLNNDTWVLNRDWLEQMIRVASQPDVGIVGATLFYPDGTLQHAGLFQREDGVWEHLGRGERRVPTGPRIVPAVSAACLLMGLDLYHRLGGLDESRPVTHNDVELCRRARALGKMVAVTPHARLLHYESLSRGYALTPPDVSEWADSPRSVGG